MLNQIIQGSTFSTVLVAVTVGLLAAWVLRRARYKMPPGPWALPLVGNLLQCDSKRLHKQMYEWSLKHGPVISLYMGTHYGVNPTMVFNTIVRSLFGVGDFNTIVRCNGPIATVVVNDITTALEVLVKKTTDFAGRMKLPSIDLISDGGRDIALASYGHTWHMQRKISTKALRMYMQGENLNKMVHGAMAVTIKEMEKTSGPFSPSEYIAFTVCNILTGLCFGGTYDYGDVEIKKVLELEDNLLKVFSGLVPEDVIPGLKYVYKSKTWKEIEVLYDGLITNFIKKRFEEEEATFDRNNIRHFTDFLLLAKLQTEEADGKAAVEGLTKTHLIQTCSDIFFAGIDTSRTTLAFAVLDMINNPEIQEKVFQEVDSAVGRDRLPNLKDRPNLSYTEAVLHESMRLHNVVPTGVAHTATCDTTINGYDVPKGTVVMINHWALQHRPDVWDEPDRFIPERFLDADGKMGPKPPGWLPFSAGKRVCLGEFVAKPELHLLFATFMQQFKWRSAPGVTPDMKEDGTFLFLMPKPYNAVIEKRF